MNQIVTDNNCGKLRRKKRKGTYIGKGQLLIAGKDGYRFGSIFYTFTCMLLLHII